MSWNLNLHTSTHKNNKRLFPFRLEVKVTNTNLDTIRLSMKTHPVAQQLMLEVHLFTLECLLQISTLWRRNKCLYTWGEDFLRFLCLVAVVLIRFVVHTPSPADTGFPDIDPHRAGAQSTPYFAPFAGAHHPLPPYVRGTGWSRYIGPREKLTPLLQSEHAKQDLPPLSPDVAPMHRRCAFDKKNRMKIFLVIIWIVYIQHVVCSTEKTRNIALCQYFRLNSPQKDNLRISGRSIYRLFIFAKISATPSDFPRSVLDGFTRRGRLILCTHPLSRIVWYTWIRILLPTYLILDFYYKFIHKTGSFSSWKLLSL